MRLNGHEKFSAPKSIWDVRTKTIQIKSHIKIPKQKKNVLQEPTADQTKLTGRTWPPTSQF